MKDRILNVKLLKDGTGRVCIHFLVPDDVGLIETRGMLAAGHGPILDKQATRRWRIACNPKQNSINPQKKGHETFMCIQSDDIRAVTCPLCLASVDGVERITFVEELEKKSA